MAESKVRGGHTGTNADNLGQPHRLNNSRKSFPGNRNNRFDKLDQQNQTRLEHSAFYNECSIGYNTDNMSQQKEGAEGKGESIHKAHSDMHYGTLDKCENGCLSYQTNTPKTFNIGFNARTVDEGSSILDKFWDGTHTIILAQNRRCKGQGLKRGTEHAGNGSSLKERENAGGGGAVDRLEQAAEKLPQEDCKEHMD
eukprot:16442214-Heterocapsa_arctica.AAC.1